MKQTSELQTLQREIITVFSTVNDDGMYEEVLKLLRDHFESPFGYFGYIDEQRNLVCPSMTYNIWDRCKREDRDIVFPADSWGGLWGYALKDGKTYFSNIPLSPPQGHLAITRAVAVPLLFRNKLIGQFVLANKETDYTELDIENLNSIAEFVAPVMNARLERDRALAYEREARRKAEEANTMKSTFLASMSHEIRTPLNAIIGFQDILLENASLTKEFRFYLEQAKNSSHILLQLINDLLDFSKIDADELSLQEVPFSLIDVMDNIYSIARMTLDKSEKKIELQTDIPPNSDIYLIGDPSRLEQVLINLITNAIKFTDNGFVRYGFSFNDKTEIQFYVQDTGAGIPKEKQELIFESFRQAEEKIAQKQGGTGLGLAISKKLAEMMGGSITLTSQPGSGTTFYFTVPYREADVEHDQKKPASIPENAVQTVLVVDDNRINRLVIKTMLQKSGYTVHTASDGMEALHVLKRQPSIGLILMDMYMPTMDGIEATKRIRREEKEAGKTPVPIIALTAAGTAEDKNVMERAGSDGFHSKPIDKEKLLEQIQSLSSQIL